jgi:multidrug efflux pump subunit AcrA (membrane-fusion protein)
MTASPSKPAPSAARRAPVLVILVVAVALGGWYLFSQHSATANATLVASGTIEATQIHLGTEVGGRVEAVTVKEGDAVHTDQLLAQVHPISNASFVEQIRSPIEGVVLERSVEPGELTSPGSTLLTVGDLYQLTLTVYVPEDRYGRISLGQVYSVTVDSFPNAVFPGKVTHIADQAEFTPRNVETVEGRKNTVFAIRLTLDNPNLALKPGMPADVNFGIK